MCEVNRLLLPGSLAGSLCICCGVSILENGYLYITCCWLPRFTCAVLHVVFIKNYLNDGLAVPVSSLTVFTVKRFLFLTLFLLAGGFSSGSDLFLSVFFVFFNV